MKLKLKSLWSPDLAHQNRTEPIDKENFSLLLQAFVGQEGGDGQESFDFIVCTPVWLSRELQEKRGIFSRHYLVVSTYNFDEIQQMIVDKIKECERESWEESAQLLSRYGHWEFEDYKE